MLPPVYLAFLEVIKDARKRRISDEGTKIKVN